jgi:hypothetical protein
MLYSLSSQMYKYEHGLTAAEQRAADVSLGEAAAALRDLRLDLGRIFRLRHRVPVECSVGRGNALHADPHR